METMTLLLSIALGISVGLNVAAIFMIFRLSKRLLQFDELFDLLADDIEVNVSYFKKLLTTPLLENSPEVVSMQKNIDVIGRRLQEFAIRMSETTNKETTGE